MKYAITPQGTRVTILDVDTKNDWTLVISCFNVRAWWIDSELLTEISKKEWLNV